jgi:hypothetical protein
MTRDASPSEVDIHRVFGPHLPISIFLEDLASPVWIRDKFTIEPIRLILNHFEDNKGRLADKR